MCLGNEALVHAYILKCKDTTFFLIGVFFFNHPLQLSLAVVFEG